MTKITNTTRRALLQKMAAIPMASAATPMALQLLGMANAAAQSAPDYKALVCVFLFGGNDHYNTVIPYDSLNYDKYWTIRRGQTWPSPVPGHYSGIAIKRDALFNSALAGTGLASGLQMALHPSMAGGVKSLSSMFNNTTPVAGSGKLGIILNAGALIQPTTKADFNNPNSRVPIPAKLFSHNDQQAFVQSGAYTEGAVSGWGGRMADLILGQNTPAALTCISVTGNVLFTSGSKAVSYPVSPNHGPITVNAIRNGNLYQSSHAATALRQIVTEDRKQQALEEDYNTTMNNALSTAQTLSEQIGATPVTNAVTNFFTSSNTNPLSAQLKMVARIMEKRDQLGLKRQVFMVGLGGFDLHDNLPEKHDGLLKNLNDALCEFDSALQYLGINDSVTTFTTSDFGRTLASNGDGSDHGWGGHYFVMGGQVRGNRFFGTAPEIGLNHNQEVGSGRLLPSIANDQISYELARWFGVNVGDREIRRALFPNADNFALGQLGLFAS